MSPLAPVLFRVRPSAMGQGGSLVGEAWWDQVASELGDAMAPVLPPERAIGGEALLALRALTRLDKGRGPGPSPLERDFFVEVPASEQETAAAILESAVGHIAFVMRPAGAIPASLSPTPTHCTSPPARPHLDEAERGVGARDLWHGLHLPVLHASRAARRGYGVPVGVLELAFPPKLAGLVLGPDLIVRGPDTGLTSAATTIAQQRDHAARTLSVLFSDHEADHGLEGLCVEAGPVCLHSLPGGGDVLTRIRDGILLAAVELALGAIPTDEADLEALLDGASGRGTVLLLEIALTIEERASGCGPMEQAWVPGIVEGYPLECRTILHDAIAVAAAAEICVVEPSGNVEISLGQVVEILRGHCLTDVVDPAVSPTGAVLVGQAMPCSNQEASCAHGLPVHFFAPGGAIKCLAWSDTGGTGTTIMDAYGGTSAAAAVIAGCAAITTAISRELTGAVLPPGPLVARMRTGATPSRDDKQNAVWDRVGGMPALRSIQSATPLSAWRRFALTVPLILLVVLVSFLVQSC